METARLYLREQTKELLGHILQQPVPEQLNFFGFQSAEQLDRELAKIEERNAQPEKGVVKWDLVDRESGKVVGNCGFHNWLAGHEKAELGYFLHEAFRKKGYMLEALESVIGYGFNTMRLNRIEAFVSPENLPSVRIMEKLGFTKEGLLREHYKFEGRIYDSIVFSLLRSEYNNRPQLRENFNA